MTSAQPPPPPEVLNHPRFCRGAGHAGRFRLRPEVTLERFLATLKRVFSALPKQIGLTSFRVIRFDDGTYLLRSTYVSVAAWKRHSAQMDQTKSIMQMIHGLLDVDHSEIWMGMYTLIPARYAPDLDHPSAPQPVNPCEIEHQQQQQASASAATDDADTLPDGRFRGDDDDDDDDDTASSIVSLSVTVSATDRRHARRLPSIASARSGASLSPAVDVLSPSPSDFLRYQSASATSTHVQPPSRAYTEARSSVGLTPDRESPYSAAGHRGGVNFSSYWRSAVWSAPSAPPASVPRGVPDPYFAPTPPRRSPHAVNPASSDSRAPRTKLRGLPQEMVHHMPEVCYTILPPGAGPRDDGPADAVRPGFTILIDGDPVDHFRIASRDKKKKQRVIYLSAAAPLTSTAAQDTKQPQLYSPQPPTAEALASTGTRATSAGGSTSSGDNMHMRNASSRGSSGDHNRGPTRGSTPTSVACTAGDDESVLLPEATVASSTLSSYSNAATSKTASTTGVASRGSRGVGGKNKAPVLCVLVAFTDDKKKKKCRLDTGVCPEPQPGQIVRVRDGVAPDGGGGDAKLRAAKVLTVTPWSTRKGGSSSGSIAALPAVVGIAQV